MSRIPELQSELVAAAARRAEASAGARSRRSLHVRPLRTPIVIALLALTLAAGTAVAALTGVVGGPPTATFPRVHGEEGSGMARLSDPYVLGIADVTGVGQIELVGYRMRGYQGHGILNCLDLSLPDGTKGGSCDAGLPGEAGGVMGTGAGTSRPLVLATGVGGTDVDRVVVRYRVGRGRASRPATVIDVPGAVGGRLGLGAFTYYVAALPHGARDLAATGFDRGGSTLWRARFF